MDIEEHIFARLSGDAALAALVGAKVYPVICPPGTAAPYVIFQKVGTDPATVHDGAGELAHDLYQFSCVGATYAQARAVRAALKAALDGVALASGDIPILSDERHDYESAVDLHRADADFFI